MAQILNDRLAHSIPLDHRAQGEELAERGREVPCRQGQLPNAVIRSINPFIPALKTSQS